MHLALTKFMIWFRFFSFIVSSDFRLGTISKFGETLGTVLLFWDDTAYRLIFVFDFFSSCACCPVQWAMSPLFRYWIVVSVVVQWLVDYVMLCLLDVQQFDFLIKRVYPVLKAPTHCRVWWREFLGSIPLLFYLQRGWFEPGPLGHKWRHSTPVPGPPFSNLIFSPDFFSDWHGGI
jgi:hypothetical protein